MVAKILRRLTGGSMRGAVRGWPWRSGGGRAAPPKVAMEPAAFVESLYIHLLGRLPDPADAAAYAAQLRDGTMPGALVQVFIESEEARGRYILKDRANPQLVLEPAAFVETVHRHLLGRLPDPAETACRLASLNAGMVPAALVEALLESEEGRRRHILNDESNPRIGLDPAAFVESLYLHVLGRLPDAAEAASHVAGLKAGTPPAALVKAFLESEEGRRRYIPNDENDPRIALEPAPFVESVLSHVLERGPEPAEVAFHAARLQAGTSPAALVAEFLESEEARGRCLGLRTFVPAGHYYSPVVDPASIAGRFRNRAIPEHIPGIAVSRERHEALWRDFARHFAEMPFTPLPRDGLRYHFENPSFAYGDGLLYYSMLRRIRPRRVIEIGSGYTSALLLDVIDRFLDEKPQCSFIEPYPGLIRTLLSDADLARHLLFAVPVQEVPVDLFRTLEDGDILFIDSSHVLKTGSDTHHELFEILPVLNPGVHVHLHDIFWPFEYPEAWVLDDNRSWNEAYALRAFLTGNSEFEITFFNDYFGRFCRDLIDGDMPLWGRNPGGSLWLRKRAAA